MTIHHGDCIEVMAAMEPDSIDAIVTDPPYGLEFMGKEWDRLWDDRGAGSPRVGSDGVTRQRGTNPFSQHQARPNYGNDSRSMQAWHARWAEAAYRVAKPSAYLLAFGGTRTVHRMTVALEDAGWIIRDMLVWAYLQGFPKSRASLKPSWEPIVLARKPGPLRELNIEDCRIAYASDDDIPEPVFAGQKGPANGGKYGNSGPYESKVSPIGRWPANIVMTEPVFGDASRVFQVGRSGTPSDRMGTCQTCGAPIAEQRSTARTQPLDTAPPTAVTPPPEYPGQLAFDAASPSLSPTTATAPRRAATSPDGTLASTSQPMASLSTSDSATPSSSDDGGTTRRTPRSKPLGTSPESERPSSLAKSPDAASLETGTTTTTPDPLTCDTCADPTTSVTTRRSRVPADDPDHPRFLIIPKADRSDREPVLGGLPNIATTALVKNSGNVVLRCADCARTHSATERHTRTACARCGGPNLAVEQAAMDGTGRGQHPTRSNFHPTVKPTELMRHLVRLVTPAGGTVLDPFGGSGTTALACELEGFPWILVEKEAEYVAIAEARLNGTQRGLGLSA